MLLEPLPDVFEILKKNYRHSDRLKFLNAAISNEDGFRTLYTVRIENGVSEHADLYSSFDRGVISRQTQWVPDIEKRIEEKQIRCISFETLLREIGEHEVDLLQVDAEGYDFEILKMIDFSRV